MRTDLLFFVLLCYMISSLCFLWYMYIYLSRLLHWHWRNRAFLSRSLKVTHAIDSIVYNCQIFIQMGSMILGWKRQCANLIKFLDSAWICTNLTLGTALQLMQIGNWLNQGRLSSINKWVWETIHLRWLEGCLLWLQNNFRWLFWWMSYGQKKLYISTDGYKYEMRLSMIFVSQTSLQIPLVALASCWCYVNQSTLSYIIHQTVIVHASSNTYISQRILWDTLLYQYK